MEVARNLIKYRLRTYTKKGEETGSMTHSDLNTILAEREKTTGLDSFLDLIWRDVVIFTEVRTAEGSLCPDSIIRIWTDREDDWPEKVVGG